MGESGRAEHGIWPRAAGISGFALFCSAFLLAIGLGELVLVAAVVVVCGALVFTVGWLLLRQRRAIAGAAVTGQRILSPAAARSARAAYVLLSRLLALSVRAGGAVVVAAEQGMRSVAREGGPAVARARTWLQELGAGAGKRTRAGIESAAPVVRRAQQEAVGQLRAVGSLGTRQVSRAAAVVASDLAAHRQRARVQHHKGRELPPPSRSLGWADAPADVPARNDTRGSRSRRSGSGNVRQGRS